MAWAWNAIHERRIGCTQKPATPPTALHARNTLCILGRNSFSLFQMLYLLLEVLGSITKCLWKLLNDFDKQRFCLLNCLFSLICTLVQYIPGEMKWLDCLGDSKMFIRQAIVRLWRLLQKWRQRKDSAVLGADIALRKCVHFIEMWVFSHEILHLEAIFLRKYSYLFYLLLIYFTLLFYFYLLISRICNYIFTLQ